LIVKMGESNVQEVGSACAAGHGTAMNPAVPIAVAAANIFEAPIKDNCMGLSPLLDFTPDRAQQINRQWRLSTQFGRSTSSLNGQSYSKLTANLQRCRVRSSDKAVHIPVDMLTGVGVIKCGQRR
jgi:hypothetical protein